MIIRCWFYIFKEFSILLPTIPPFGSNTDRGISSCSNSSSSVCVCRKMVTGLSFVVHSARVINNRFTMLTRNVQVFLHLIIANKLSLKIIKRNAFHNLNVFTSNQLLPIKSIGYLIAFNKKFPVF